jgi:hypothetical protein
MMKREKEQWGVGNERKRMLDLPLTPRISYILQQFDSQMVFLVERRGCKKESRYGNC